ncbi:MAG TPA: calcium-binding protein [Paracoccus sp. (in: a-proteobacteria)]|uniref:calcium-binding protein n=1 Tax=Paracoccus sp. TaxID=267 RepID=UPI002D03D1FA|nr:calcium-binding protein [Paracoccus sp. (in: a-proteobacteria)]HWL58480.1 calcium-binding protein [Paracoccus sp. (in: a-proteobacteria)]
MSRHTVTARTYVTLNGPNQSNTGWGLEFHTSGAGAGDMRIMDIYSQGSGSKWTFLGGVSFFPDYSGVTTLGGGEVIGRSFALATIPRGTALSQLVVSDRITLGQGDFLIEGSARGDFWNGARGGNDEIYGLGGNDTLLGGRGNDSISGGSGNDSLVGGAGADLLIGNAGRDTLVGGAGNDRYVIDRQDVVIEAAGQGRDHVQADFDYGLAANVEDLTLTGIVGYSGSGNGLANGIHGNSGANLLRGYDGNDSLYGGAGNDTLIGGNGNDLLQGDAGNDLLRGIDGIDTAVYAGNVSVRVDLSNPNWQNTGQGTDMLAGIENLVSGAGRDTLTGDNGANMLDGGAGNDSLTGGAGHDTLKGGAGADTMVGGAGNDIYWVDNTGDLVVEQIAGGIDRINASIGIDLARAGGVYANVENVTLTGSAAIAVHGSALNNVLTGNAAANVISGRAGNDNLTGGGGADTFVFRKGFDQDRILDFQDDVDRIRLQGFADVTNTTEARAHASQIGGNVLFDFGDGDLITVHNARIAAVLDDLIFA